MRDRATLGGLGLPVPAGGDAPVAGLCVDSREAAPGFVFFAIRGEKLDGAEFAGFAARQGAEAVVVAPAGAAAARAALGEAGREDVPLIEVENPRLALARAAAAFYGRQPETVAAVTGTNGKTSVVSFLRQIWAALGVEAASFGTVGVEGAAAAGGLAHTTPEPITLHRLLAELADGGVTHAAMEASSHGLAQHRVDGVRLRAAALTNVTRDHLDYHADARAYLAPGSGSSGPHVARRPGG